MLHLQRLDAKLTEQQIRNYLGGYNFHGDRVLEPIAPFSGGEKARLVLALLIYQKPNLLLLDEPTNHLDLEMRHALSMALQDYEGAMVLVSHDRHLLNAVTDQFLLVDQGKVVPFNDDLDAYRNWLMQPKFAAQTDEAETESARSSNKKAQRQQQAEQRKQLNPLKKEVKKLEHTLQQLEQEIQKLEHELSQPEIYQEENRQRMEDITKQRAQASSQLSEIEESWLLKSEELDVLSAQIAC